MTNGLTYKYPTVHGVNAFAASPNGNGAELDLISQATPTVPAQPTNLTLYAADSSRFANVTDLTQPRLTGTATAGVGVQIYNTATNKLVAAATAGTNGVFIATQLASLLPGTYTFEAVAYNQYGYGTNSLPYTFTIVPKPLAADRPDPLRVQRDQYSRRHGRRPADPHRQGPTRPARADL